MMNFRSLFGLIVVGVPMLAGTASATPTTVNVAADLPAGVDSGLLLSLGETIDITASGQAAFEASPSCVIQTGASCGPLTMPDGTEVQNGQHLAPKIDPNADLPSAPIGALLGRIGSGDLFYVGTSLTLTASAAGELFFVYNDSNGGYANNFGSYTATVTPEVTADLPAPAMPFLGSVALLIGLRRREPR